MIVKATKKSRLLNCRLNLAAPDMPLHLRQWNAEPIHKPDTVYSSLHLNFLTRGSESQKEEGGQVLSVDFSYHTSIPIKNKYQ